eukprot:PhM_4_TR18425/c4_g1_i4/m.85268
MNNNNNSNTLPTHTTFTVNRSATAARPSIMMEDAASSFSSFADTQLSLSSTQVPSSRSNNAYNNNNNNNNNSDVLSDTADSPHPEDREQQGINSPLSLSDDNNQILLQVSSLQQRQTTMASGSSDIIVPPPPPLQPPARRITVTTTRRLSGMDDNNNNKNTNSNPTNPDSATSSSAAASGSAASDPNAAAATVNSLSTPLEDEPATSSENLTSFIPLNTSADRLLGVTDRAAASTSSEWQPVNPLLTPNSDDEPTEPLGNDPYYTARRTTMDATSIEQERGMSPSSPRFSPDAYELSRGDEGEQLVAPPSPPPPPPPAPSKDQKIQQVLKKHKGFYPPDGPVVRYWYALQLICAAYSYISATRTIVYDDTHSTGELLFGLVISCVFIVDCHVHSRLVRPTYRLVGLDVIPALPFEVVLLATPLTHSWRILLSCVRALKLMRVPSMFRMSMPDVINTHYVLFYYKVLPTMLFLYWFMLFLHTLVVWRLLASSTGDNYHQAVSWVWTILSSAPVGVKRNTTAESILAGFLMTTCMILQGYVVGAMSVLVFSYNVEEETRTQMLTTLEMLKHYDLPVEARDEVLSFQHHTLAESHVRASSHATLDKLPPAMLRQIQLY